MSAQRLDRFDCCGSALWLKKSPTGDEVALSANCCHDRWCQACARVRGATIAANLASKLEGKPLRFGTLTRRHSSTPLSEQIDGIYECFRRLRERKWWTERVSGGAAFLEIKLSERTGLWHVHLHLVIDAKWMDQRELSAQWLAVTNDSSIVDIRLVHDTVNQARYLTKYVTKPADASVFQQPDKLDELTIALKGRRTCLTFGTWRGFELEPHTASTKGWTAIGRVEELAERARTGEPDALRWVEVIRRKWPLLFAVLDPPPPRLTP